METAISVNNPFGWDRYGFLYEVLHARQVKPRHLDYGAYDGAILCDLSRAGVLENGIGLDVNTVSLDERRADLPENVKLAIVVVKPRVSIPFEDESFDTASILDVIEHISDQELVLTEIARVLKPGGELVITVPGQHAFSWLDLGNFKFRFPWLHRKFYGVRHSKDAYRERYVECRDGLFGDVELAKMWHQHFSPGEMQDLLVRCGFEVVKFDGAGFFHRLFTGLKFFLPFLTGLFDRLILWDAKKYKSANLFCLARKRIRSPV